MFSRFFSFIITTILLFLLATGVVVYKERETFKKELGAFAVEAVGKKAISNTQDFNLFQKILGFEKEKTYLLLFLNNTEMRPGGGFIGTYAVMKVDKGIPKILKVEGTEILDNKANQSLLLDPPKPIGDYLKVEKWNFRDSNWSPDFILSSKLALDFYKKENGLEAENIDGVIGFTPTVLEEILRIGGPIKIEGEEYNFGNFTEKLEYEVEYKYADKGVSFDNRKKIIGELAGALVGKLGRDIFLHWKDFFNMVEEMFKQKQVAFYFKDEDIQSAVLKKGWAGEMSSANTDFILWADANLGALKTDAAIERTLFYYLDKDSDKRFVGEVKMKIKHNGKYDWRTSVYLDYARVFLPMGSELIEAKFYDKSGLITKIENVDAGKEGNRQWFGTFIKIKPGETGELAYKFYVSPLVAEKIESDNYSLLVQKQIGLRNAKLTLRLNFGKNIVTANPFEEEKERGDAVYLWEGEFETDKQFGIQFK